MAMDRRGGAAVEAGGQPGPDGVPLAPDAGRVQRQHSVVFLQPLAIALAQCQPETGARGLREMHGNQRGMHVVHAYCSTVAGSDQSIGGSPRRARYSLAAEKCPQPMKPRCAETVSYTHLTLP